MSEPAATSPAANPQQQHHLHRAPPHYPATASVGPTAASTPMGEREYRKGNWTIQETLILITAKKLDEERRHRARSAPPPDQASSSSAAATSASAMARGELRWKWVENYCWSHGCQRSSNQCNDKWDNLLRDYKKVREYESIAQSNPDTPSYWSMEKQDRKHRNLPSNMVLEVFQALNDVLQRKYSSALRDPQSLPPSPSPAPLSSRPLLPAPAASERSESWASENEEEESEATKRRKHGEIGSSIKRSASLLAKTIQNCEEKKEKRHREIMEMERRKLEIEEAQNEVNRQGISNLVGAVANLSTAIQSLVSYHHQPS